MPAHALRSRAPAVRLEASAPSDAEEAPRWIMVAYEGRWLGHHQGAFSLTPETFDAIVRNFHTHPAYKRGPNGVGIADTVPIDFGHATEADPTRGDLPVVGAPAQGWVLDVERRRGESGRAELWALARFLEPAATYIREKKLRWVSVSVWFDAIDPVTGQQVGPTLTSVAATNTPYLQALPPLAASYEGVVSTPRDALAALRSLFELPATSGLGDVIAEIAKVRAWTTAAGGAPLGVDPADLTGALRRIFNLPTMASSAEVFAEADKLLARLAEEQAALSPPPAAPAPPSPEPPAAQPAALEPAAFVAATAQPPPETTPMTTPAVTPAVTPAASDLKTLLAQRFDLKPEEANEGRIVLAIEQGQEARRTLTSLLEALGVPTAQAAGAKVAELLKSAATLATIAPEHEAMKVRVAAIEDQEAEAEVDRAMLAYAMPASAKKSMLLHRRGDATDFAKTYPLPDPKLAHLSQSVATPPPATPSPASSSPLDRIQASRGGLRIGPPVAPPPALGSGAAAINLDAFPGANNVQRALSMLRAQGDKRPFHELHAAACDIARAATPA